MPAGGVGLTGWLSAIWAALTTRTVYTMPFVAFGTAANGSAAVGAAMTIGPSPTQYTRARARCVATAAGGTFQFQGSNDNFVSSFVFLANATVVTGGIAVDLECPAQMAGIKLVYVPGPNAANITATMSLHTA